MSDTTYGHRWPIYAHLWDNCHISGSRLPVVTSTVLRLMKNKSRYQTIEKLTGVPWYLVAALHERESSGNFNTQLAQGDPLHSRSRHQPISGPFATFEDSAVWALAHDTLSQQTDWRIEKILYYAERWNGWGYALYHSSCPSPYVWGATTVQKPGKYVADGVWSSSAIDSQLGVAAMLLGFAAHDSSIHFVRETVAGTPGDIAPPIQPQVPQKIKKTPPVKHPGWWATFWAWLTRTRAV